MQLQLDLFPGVPWSGRSPRFLTRCSEALFLRREPQKDDRNRIDPDQMDLFHAAITPPRKPSEGAPLLLEPRGFQELFNEGG